jgi:hypothetical protein
MFGKIEARIHDYQGWFAWTKDVVCAIFYLIGKTLVEGKNWIDYRMCIT